MNNISIVEVIAKTLKLIDKHGTDYRITKTEFDLVKEDKHAMKILLGKSLNTISWDNFKFHFIEYQNSLGFEWSKSRGQFGTLTLDKVVLQPEIGEDLAKELMEKKIKKGDFNEYLDKYLPELKSYLDLYNFDSGLYDRTRAKISFSDTAINNQRYKFTTRSYTFELGIEQYQFQGNSKKPEVELGESIDKSGKLKNILNIEFLLHQQEKRKYKKYQNVDFEGYRILRKVSGDEIEVINIELKPANKIESVSDAISQAINYKESANRTYIMIPLFVPRSFYDPDRFQNFVKLCEENELGIISINIDPESHEIQGLDIILEAPKREIVKYDRANKLLKENGKEYCPLCRRIVSSNQERIRCGWNIPLNDKNLCMKEHFEKFLTKTINPIST